MKSSPLSLWFTAAWALASPLICFQVACSQAKVSPSTASSASPDAAARKKLCSQRSVAECDSDAQCTRLRAELIDEANSCATGQSSDVACSDTSGCGAALTLAYSPSHKLWRFPSTCVPHDWSVVRPKGAIADSCSSNKPLSECQSEQDSSQACLSAMKKFCIQRSLAECEQHPACEKLTAERINGAAACKTGERRAVACGAHSGRMGCGAALTLARAPDQTLWLFNSTCVPHGWSVTRPKGAIADSCG